jgi:TRAP-type uncharacterized transport system substrate-binding protein
MQHYRVQGAERSGSNVADSKGIEQVSTPEEWAGLAPSSQELHRSNLDAAKAIVLVGGWSAGKVWSLLMRRDLSGLGSIRGDFIISKLD